MARPGEGNTPRVWLKLSMESWLNNMAFCLAGFRIDLPGGSHHVCQYMARLHFQVQVSSASSGKPLASGLYILCSLPVGSGIIRVIKRAFG